MHYNLRMRTRIRNYGICLLLSAFSQAAFADASAITGLEKPGENLRVLSWNISEDAFVDTAPEFHTLITQIQPDILLLDEVKPTSNEDMLREALPNAEPMSDLRWHINFGTSGGRQVGVIVSRYPLEEVPEFTGKLEYTQKDHDYISAQMSPQERTYQNWTINDGIAANAAIVLAGERRILAVSFDMQCCGNDPGSWQEYRRRIEAREIRKLVLAVLQRTRVDGIVVAGDLNIVSTPLPLVILSNLNNQTYSNLSIAEVYQSDGRSWTWDGRASQYPSRVMDFQLYTGASLQLQAGFIFNSELLSADTLHLLELEATTSRQLSDHLPIVVDYQWK